MDKPAEVDPRTYVIERLDEAGKTLMSLPGRGCFPTGYRSSMPEYLHMPGDGSAAVNPYLSASHAERPRPNPPGAREISRMDEVYQAWVPLLPARTELELRTRRLVLLRSLVWPVSDHLDPHVWSWRRLGDLFAIEHHTAKSRFDSAIDRLAWKLRVPDTCAQTLERIMRHDRRRVMA